jgi:hypothetical protein
MEMARKPSSDGMVREPSADFGVRGRIFHYRGAETCVKNSEGGAGHEWEGFGRDSFFVA